MSKCIGNLMLACGVVGVGLAMSAPLKADDVNVPISTAVYNVGEPGVVVQPVAYGWHRHNGYYYPSRRAYRYGYGYGAWGRPYGYYGGYGYAPPYGGYTTYYAPYGGYNTYYGGYGYYPGGFYSYGY